jgi:glycosyltransferase involved in cell wall biosynthesis
LQGIPYIIKAAKLLESYPDIYFKVIGSGQLSKEIRELSKNLQLKNISFIEWVKYEELPEHIANTDVCLGIFGDTEKAKRGIPIKAFEALAVGKPLITGDSPAAKEVFLDKENAILCKIANAEALATSILLLKRDIKLRKKIAEAGKKLYRDKLSIDYIGKVMKVALTETINSQQRLTRKLTKRSNN